MFMNYLDPTVPLETRIEIAFDELGIEPAQREKIRNYLAPLRAKNGTTFSHYQHSLRVALVARAIARHLRLDERALLYVGLLHDIGKVASDPTTLAKTTGWTTADSREMEQHVMDSYRMLRGCFDFTAEIALRHHQFQRNRYPAQLPPPIHDHQPETWAMIVQYARVLSLADAYDALHRRNDAYGVTNGHDIHVKLLEQNEDIVPLIEELYAIGVFTEEIR